MKINWNGLSSFTKEKCQGGICKTPCKHLSREAAIRKEFLDPTLYNPTRSNIYHENYDIAIAMSSSHADSVLGHCLAGGI